MIVPSASVSISKEAPSSVTADVAIVGAGLAGLYLAFQLRRRGLRVAVIEAGSPNPNANDAPSAVQMTGRNHLGVSSGRSVGLGGTSALWSGGLIPLADGDTLARPHVALEAWPLQYGALARNRAEVERFFAVDDDAYDCVDVHTARLKQPSASYHPSFTPRYAKIVPFKSRNVAQILKRALKNDPHFQVFANANVTDILIDQSGERVGGLLVQGQTGSFYVRANNFVLAAGALETTRLLLNLKERGGSRVLTECHALGRYFFDHLSTVAGRFKPRNITAFSEFGAYHFMGAAMRSMRLELSGAAQAADRVLSVYGYIHYEGGSEFQRLRRLMHDKQHLASISPMLALDALKLTPGLAKMLYWRLYQKRLLWTENGTFSLRLVGEQFPRYDSRLQLSTDTDSFGQPLLTMNWITSAVDFKSLRAFCKRFDGYWRDRSLDTLASLDWDGEPGGAVENAADFYHPAGTTRMGTDRSNSVVRPDLRLHDISNLFVASTSVFPSGGSSNPTLTLLLLAHSLAETLSSERLAPARSALRL